MGSDGIFFVLDQACGLVVAAMAKQLAGKGRIYRVSKGGASQKAIDDLDLGVAKRVVRTIPLGVLQSDDPWSHEWLQPPPEGLAKTEDSTHVNTRRERTAEVVAPE